MKPEDALLKAQKEKIEAKLQEARAKLNELDAAAKERKAKAEIEAIVALRARRDEIQARMREFTALDDAKSALVRADIDARVADFLEEISKLATRVKSHIARG